MHGLDDLVVGRLQLAGGDGLGDEFRGVVADDVAAEEFAVLGVVDHLDEAFVVTGRRGFARSGEGELTLLDLVAGLLGFLFGVARRSVYGGGGANGVAR